MRNEDKAREIASKEIIGLGPDYYDVAYDSAMEMAEWKDKQLINKACRWLKKNWVRYPNPDVRTVQLVADFRKAMEELQ